MVATPEPPLACCCLQEIPQHGGLHKPLPADTPSVRGTAQGLPRVLSWAQEGSVCTNSQVQAHVHEHKYPPTHTASEQMTQRFLWKDVRSI